MFKTSCDVTNRNLWP